MTMADEIVNKGLNKLGYEYVIIDDCWLDHQRSPEGKLVPDPRRFPSGIKWLADYIHSKGLKFGIYEDYVRAHHMFSRICKKKSRHFICLLLYEIEIKLCQQNC